MEGIPWGWKARDVLEKAYGSLAGLEICEEDRRVTGDKLGEVGDGQLMTGSWPEGARVMNGGEWNGENES